MGGKGSGRLSKEAKIVKGLQRGPEIVSKEVAGNFVLPNNSGDHMRGFKRDTPVRGYDLVNKDYVDASVAGGLALYLTEDASDIGTYFDLIPSPGGTEENTTTAIPGSSTGTSLSNFATPDGCGCVSNLSSIPEGVMSIHLHVAAAAARRLKWYAEVYKRTSGGTETLITTSETSDFIPTTETHQAVHATVSSEVEWTSTDRIVLKLYGTNDVSASTNLTFYVEGTTASRLELTGNVPVGNNVTAGSTITDNRVVRGDGGARGVQGSSAILDDNGNLTVTDIKAEETALLKEQSGVISNTSGYGTLYAKDTDEDLYYLPSTGSEQKVLLNVVEDTTPQLGGDLDTQSHNVSGQGVYDAASMNVDASYTAGYKVGGTAGGVYVDRGDPSAWDFSVGDLTTDGTWRDLDLSSIVPAGAKAVVIKLLIQDDTADYQFLLRENGNSNTYNILVSRILVADILHADESIVAVDSARKIEYLATNTTWTRIDILVKGWFI